MIFDEIGSLFINVAALSDWRYWVKIGRAHV